MDIFTGEILQFLILQIPNFVGFILLTIVLWNMNNKLLEMLKAELEDCRDTREREQIVMLQPPSRAQRDVD